MKRLPEGVKRRIVEHLACHAHPSEVVSLIEQEFGITLTARHIRSYDPSSHQYAGSSRWTEYHKTVRERFAKETGSIAIAQRAYRLRQLNIMLERAMERGDYRQALQILRQAAKETA